MAKDVKTKNRSDKIKREIKNFKEKEKRIVGNPDITGVDKPRKKKYKDAKLKNDKDRKEKDKKKKEPVIIGPRGGKYVNTKDGKKRHFSTQESVKRKKGKDDVKKSLEIFVEKSEKVYNFIKQFKGESK